MFEAEELFNDGGFKADDPRSPVHIRHSMVEMSWQRVYRTAADYKDPTDADQLRSEPLG